MKNPYIRPFGEIGKEDAALAGGKGASLGEMTQAGIPVPPGYVVLADTFEEFIKETNLIVEIDSELGKVNHEEMHTVEYASGRIQALIHEATMPENLAAPITAAFKELGTEFVAVRSSATAEDSSEAAWAGQLDTYLNTTEKELLENVQRCWASLFTPRAIFYRFEKGLDTQKISVAVVVQKMVNSDAAGIAFSVHPVTEDRNQVIIEAGFGLGEAVVSGQITPDSYVITKEPREIIDKNIADQEQGLYRKEGGGNEWQPTPQGKNPVLTDEQILALTETVIGIEKHYGFPVDTEWAMEDNVIYITQSRPITTLTPFSEPTENFNSAPSAEQADGASAKEWQVIAQDFRSPFIRNYIWATACLRYKELFGEPAPVMGIRSHADDIEYIVQLETFKASHDALVAQAQKDEGLVEKLIDTTNTVGEDFNVWSERELFRTDLTKKRSDELMALLRQFAERQAELYAYGFTLPILDFAGFSFVEGNLERILKEHVYVPEYQEYYEVLTQPLHNSFAQDQEEDLLGLMDKHKKELAGIEALTWTDLQAKRPKLAKALSQHAKKHGWVYYVYKGPAFTEEQFLEFMQGALEKGIPPRKELARLADEKKRIRRKRETYIRKLGTSSFDTMILRLASKMVWAKPRRKDYQSRSYFHLESLLAEIGNRLGLSVDEMRSLPFTQIEEGLEGRAVDRTVPVQVYAEHVVVSGESDAVLYLGKEAETFSRTQIGSELPHTEYANGTIKGTIARRGHAQGVARIINKPEDMHKMQQGDILVSIATTPSVVPAMKKAAAIVTDEGGLTCHASIVSRELGIPCVVGTKIATKMLTDGDMVEVDADAGVVRILEKAGSASPDPTAALIEDITARDWYQDWSGLYTLLEASLDADSYFGVFEDVCGMSFSRALLTYKDETAIGWLLTEEAELLGTHLAKKLQDKEFRKEWIREYKRRADELRAFLKLPHEEFLTRFREYKDIYPYAAPYGIATKIAFNLLPPGQEELAGELEAARKYTEPLYKDSTLGINNLCRFIAEREKYPVELVRALNTEEVCQYAENRTLPDKTVLEERATAQGMYLERGKQHSLSQEEVDCILFEFRGTASQDGTVQGVGANPGVARGVCRVLFDFRDAVFNEGEVLITPMTHPYFVPLMKKAGAIVTDGGGMLSHAAIVAREMGKPCVIGTKVATQVFKDGDLVEVDANTGIVRLLDK